MPLLMSQHLSFLLSTIMVCVLSLQGNPARAQEGMVSDTDEIEVTTGSPMGESLMRARVGEVIRVDLRRGPKRFEIVEIL